MLGRRPVLVRSAGLRFGLLYAALFGVSMMAVAALLWYSTIGLVDRQTDSTIMADWQGLSERYADGGLAALEETIEQRLQVNVENDEAYLLTDPSLRQIGGNMPGWPHGLSPEADWAVLSISADGLTERVRLRRFVLPGGYILLIGRDVQRPEQMNRLMSDALFWAVAVALVLGIAGAMAVRGLFQSTLADVSETAAAISAGDLGRRVPVRGSGDEFDMLAETINDMLDRIGRLMDGVRQVSNAIAHDLRTPIARARARLEDSARPGATEAELRAAIERAQADLDGVVQVFQALLRIAEIESGARRSAFGPLDLAPLLGDLADLYEAAADEAGQRLARSIPDRLPAYGDREMIQQAVANLLDNALKFSPAGSTIQVSARADAAGVQVVVADQGPGIPPADREHAAERFFRGETARTTPGSGLGLSLVQAVATLHGGALRLEDNEPGLRAVLDFLPAAAGMEQVSRPPQRKARLETA